MSQDEQTPKLPVGACPVVNMNAMSLLDEALERIKFLEIEIDQMELELDHVYDDYSKFRSERDKAEELNAFLIFAIFVIFAAVITSAFL